MKYLLLILLVIVCGCSPVRRGIYCEGETSYIRINNDVYPPSPIIYFDKDGICKLKGDNP